MRRCTVKRILTCALVCALIISLLTGCVSVRQNDLPEVSLSDGDYGLRAAVVYDGSAGTESWRDTLSRLEQPLMLGLEAEAADISGGMELSGYDIIYLDESIMSSALAGEAREAVMAFARNGGAVYCPNGFYDFFPPSSSGRRASPRPRSTPITWSTPRSARICGRSRT